MSFTSFHLEFGKGEEKPFVFLTLHRLLQVDEVFVLRSYEAEIAYLDVKSDKADTEFKEDDLNGRKKSSCCGHRKKQKQVICRANCEVCNAHSLVIGESRWLKSKGHFLSAGAAVISCRNEKAPDGLVADAHLSDGFLHLILVKNCWHASYLW